MHRCCSIPRAAGMLLFLALLAGPTHAQDGLRVFVKVRPELRAVTGAQGRTLSVKYKDGEQRIVVPPQVPIVTFEPGRRDDLKAGAHVVMFVRADAQGTLVAQRVLVGKDGMVPPM